MLSASEPNLQAGEIARSSGPPSWVTLRRGRLEGNKKRRTNRVRQNTHG
jgi:hypothetical protein